MVPHMAFRVGLLDTTPYESKWVFGPHEIDHKIRAMIIMFLSGDVACRRSMKHPAVCSLHQNTRTRLPTRQDRQGNSLICAPYSVLLPDCLKSCYVSDVMDEIE